MQASSTDVAGERPMPLQVINCSDIAGSWCWVRHAFDDYHQVWRNHAAVAGALDPLKHRPYVARWRAAWNAVGDAARGPSVIVAHLPRFAYLCAEIARLRRVTAPILAFSFNFTQLPVGARRRRMASALARVDRFTVFSNHERELYCEYFGLDPRRVDMIHWGTAPAAAVTDPPMEAGRYICAIGGNARDYPTLIEAMRRLPHVRLVLVARAHNLAGLRVPSNVTVHTDIPRAAADNVLAHSRFMVLPLRDAQIASGHVTLVAAMHAGKAVVVSDSPGIADYVRQDETACITPLGDFAALAAAISRLWDDGPLCDRLGESARRFAAASCTEAAVADYFRQYLASKSLLW